MRINSERFTLEVLNLQHREFIFQLLNTPGWIQFIGNRNITSLQLATAYIEKILANAEIIYWVVNLRDPLQDQASSTAKTKPLTSIGLVTLIKRDYLEHHDIGFAFLPNYFGKGYAFEAVSLIMNELSPVKYPQILATTKQTNHSSIRLLTKLGFQFERELVVKDESLQIYKK